MRFVRRAIEEHRSGRADHGACLWSLLNFALFLERVHGGTESSTSAQMTPAKQGSASTLLFGSLAAAAEPSAQSVAR